MAKEPEDEPQHPEILREQMSAVLDKFGRYQRRLLLLLIIPLIGDGYSSMSVVLTFASPDHRCRVPGSAKDTYSIQDDEHRMLVNLSIPVMSSIGDVRYAKCDVYKGHDANTTTSNDTESCSRWVYDDTDFEETIVTQFDLVCDQKGFRANFNMVYLLGILVGSCFSGYLCDRFGRKRIFVVGNVLAIVVVIAMAFPVVPPVLLVYRFLDAAIGSASFLAFYVLLVELMGLEHRTLAGSLYMVMFVVGVMTVGVLSYPVRDWRWLQVLTGVPFIICISYWWLLDESPRWLLTRGRVQEARQVMLKIMKVNNITLPADSPLSAETLRMEDTHQHKTVSADTINTQVEDTNRMADTDNGRDAEEVKEGDVCTDKQQHINDPDKEKKIESPKEEVNFLNLFKYPNLIARTGIIFFNWSAISTTYFGLSLNVGNLTGNIRLNFLFSAVAELVGYIMAWVLLDRLGRKRTHCAAMLLSGTSCLATIFPVMFGGPDLQWVTILLVMVGKLGISAAFNAVYLMTGELFPTVIRNQGIGYSSTVARVTTAVSPYIADLSLHIEGSVGRVVPLVIFGSLALAAGLLALCLPETLHRTLPDTILQAANFTRRRTDDRTHVQDGENGIKTGRDGMKYKEVRHEQI